MKVKINVFISRNEIGSLADLHVNDIVNLDDEIAKKLIEGGKAEYEID